jgi:hypothetical protein
MVSAMISRIMLAAAMTFAAAGIALAQEDDTAAIRSLLRSTWDRPDAAVQVDPIVIAHGDAIVGWTQGEMGGRALLRRKNGIWIVFLCGGDSLREASALRAAGVDQDNASTLVASLTRAEAKLDPKRVAQFSRFEGLVTMNPAKP